MLVTSTSCLLVLVLGGDCYFYQNIFSSFHNKWKLSEQRKMVSGAKKQLISHHTVAPVVSISRD